MCRDGLRRHHHVALHTLRERREREKREERESERERERLAEEKR